MGRYTIAVVGATGNVGREMLATLAERAFPVKDVLAVASASSRGRDVSFGDQTLKVQSIDGVDFSKVDMALFSAGGAVSKKFAPTIAAQGCTVIDNSSAFRMDGDVPLVVPEINGHLLTHGLPRNIIANPNCSTIQLVMALWPLMNLAPLKRVVVSTYQSVSGAGREAMDELFRQTRAIHMDGTPEHSVFSRQIAFNAIPQIGTLQPSGYTDEEEKMMNETSKILAVSVPLVATCVRVPVFVGHGVSATVEFEGPIDVSQARKALGVFEGNQMANREEDFVTQLECAGEDPVYISRVRRDPSVPHGLSLWIVADNMRKGAALNAVQIAEALIL